MSTWTSFVTDVALSTFAIICLFEGVRRLRTFGFSMASMLAAVFGVTYCLGYAGFTYWTHKVMLDGSAAIHKGAFIPEFASDWGNNISPEQKNEIRSDIAKAVFLERGQLTYYLNQRGEKVLFSPSQLEINEREKRVALLVKMDTMIWQHSGDAYRWLTITVSTIIYGFLIARRSRRSIKGL